MESVQDERRTLTGWGRTAPTTARVVHTADVDALAEAVRESGERGVIARGLGRSYGDPSQNAGGLVLDMTALRRIHAIDVSNAIVDVDAGVSIDDLVRTVIPHGLWIPVMPGTRQVTVGGAIAADVHGKNHHTEGSFGNHVLSMDVLGADGEIRTATPDGEHAELFWAVVGGMGLVGIVLRATIRLKRAESAYFLVDTEQVHDLDELMARLQSNDEQYTYSVAWFDSVIGGDKLGRGTLTRGWSAAYEDLPPKLRKDPLGFAAPQLATVPPVFPSGMLNNLTARMFNEVWWRKSPTRFGSVQNITQFFNPLDIAAEWNRLYGPAGFLQYQFVVPFGQEDIFRRMMRTISRSGHVSALNVLKRFGAGNDGVLSFPTPGWTLAVDLPVRPGLNELCNELDDMVLEAGGRLYLAKESRTSAATLHAGYPRMSEWRALRAKYDPNGVFHSDLSRRLEL